MVEIYGSMNGERLYKKKDIVLIGIEKMEKIMITKNILAKYIIYIAVISLISGCTPDSTEAELDIVQQNTEPMLMLKLTGIYWNSTSPVVTINNEDYSVGDTVKGYTIVEIRTTEVVFRSPMGDKVVKSFYDDLED
jgi:hypothetical protein